MFIKNYILFLAEQYGRTKATDIRVLNLRILTTWERLAWLPRSQIHKSSGGDSLSLVSISEQISHGQVRRWHENVPASSRIECVKLPRRWEVMLADRPKPNHCGVEHRGEGQHLVSNHVQATRDVCALTLQHRGSYLALCWRLSDISSHHNKEVKRKKVVSTL